MNVWDLNDSDLRRAAKQIKIENRQFPDGMRKLNDHELPKIVIGTKILSVWRSRYFLCQVHATEWENIIRLSINRGEIDTTNRRWRDGITWDELQAIKSEVGYRSFHAVEVFPAEINLVNVANVRHLFVYLSDAPVFIWGTKR